MINKVEGKVALVTGANRGLGKSVVETLINRGATKVYAAVRNTEKAKGLVEKFGDKVVVIRVDLADEQTIIEAAKITSDVEIVVNNAGVGKPENIFGENVFETLDYELNINLYGTIRMFRAYTSILKNNGGGVFVQLNSTASLRAFSSMATYSISKFGSFAATQAVREDLEAQGTHLISVHPGPINTDMAQGTGLEDVAASPESVAEEIADKINAGGFFLFPDPISKEEFGADFQNFGDKVVLKNIGM